ncbi:MAG: MarR family transcriptional regulator [Ignavibacteria bacterium]|nr:MarR family transcriptional regulator [Ignavibacteria bacterium]
MENRRSYGKKADQALSLWVKLARAYETVRHRSVEDIRTYGLTQSQFGVLEALGHLGTLTPGELSKKQLSSCGTITVVLDNLETEGLVLRKRSGSDRRVTYVSLTAKGRKLFDNSFHRHAAFIGGVIGVLTDAEQHDLGRLLRKLGRTQEESFSTNQPNNQRRKETE